jgi:hypothetical protein
MRVSPSHPILLALAALALALAAACQPEVRELEDDFEFDGTCVACHQGVSAAVVHATFKLRCVDCHGGDDQVEVPAGAADRDEVFRDPDLLAQAHVKPKAGLARFFYANGIDDDGDGEVDEGPTFDDPTNPTEVLDFGEVAEPGLQGEGVGEFVDSELNRDLNYARWLNPGDLRVATVGCGSSSRAALDGEAGGACHQSVVDRMRRSMMVNQAAVLNGAYYGNESWRQDFIDARDDQGEATDPRHGAFGYVLDYTSADGCIDTSAVDDDDTGRAQPRFDSDCLEDAAGANDTAARADAPGNRGLPAFEIAQGVIGRMAGVDPGTTAPHVAANDSRYTWGGTPLLDPAASLPELEHPPEGEVVPGVPDPVDVVLRGFRAYYPLNYPGSTVNFNFTFGTSIKPEVVENQTQNPFGRGHGAGCTSCHMKYRDDGAREPAKVAEVVDGKRVEREVVDPTTKHREFDISQDLVEVGGVEQLAGRAVTSAQQAKFGREQQRTYSARHQLTTRIDTDQCGQCHGFVTRINFALQGMAEDEQRDKLAREDAIEFTTPSGTDVRILDSWVRQRVAGGVVQEVVIPEGSDIVGLAFDRDADLAALGLIPGAGGCAQNTFSEDCNNNGELDRSLTLTRVNERGETVASTTIDEDLNRNGKLDLIDHAPREKSVDGRQPRYVYGGSNGSTRQMDVHFERGMHCIDCHMLQDVHGDGHLYSTNWDAIEIECEDCHGARERATLFTTGPNGGNDLRGAIDHDGRPYFEDQGGRIIQRSRVTPGVFWEVPQLSTGEGLAAEAHSEDHLAPLPAPGARNTGSTFEGEQGSSALVDSKLECYSCHSAWVHNCMGCHFNVNLGDAVKKSVDANGLITDVPGENEVWFANDEQAGRTNFQLLSLMRSPWVLGVNSKSEAGRLAPFRSSMEAHVSITDATLAQLLDNITFTTFQKVDGNSGRANVATSSVAMNHTLPHTVRPKDVKGCETCHALVDDEGRVENEHILAETFGLGAGRYPYVGDWAIAAGAGGLELREHKAEGELGTSRFPGLVVDATDTVGIAADVEPVLDGSDGIGAAFAANDVILIRNVNEPPSAAGGVPTPTLTDLAITASTNGTSSFLIATDVTFRGHPTLAGRPSVGDDTKVASIAVPGVVAALAHLSPDVSDPHIYVVGTAGLTHVEITGKPAASSPFDLGTTVALPSGRDGTDIALAGDIAYVGTAQGTIEVFDLAEPTDPVLVETVTIGDAVNAVAVAGFVLYAATEGGVAAFSLAEPLAPATLPGASDPIVEPDVVGDELFFAGGHLYVAAGTAGVIDLDVSTPAAPRNLGDVVDQVAPGQSVNARDVVVSVLPGQVWLLVLENTGAVVGLKLDRSESTRERCFPEPSACALDMDFRDPTIMGRDPSLIANGALDPDDPSRASFFRMPPVILTDGRRLARPSMWEQIGTLSGRRLRDSFMPGSGVMSLPVMQRMHEVQVCETADPGDDDGDALNALGYFEDGACVSFEEASRARRRHDDGGVCEPADPAAADVCEPLIATR